MLSKINSNRENRNRYFTSRLIEKNDLKMAENIYSSIYPSTGMYPESINLTLDIYQNYRLSMHSPLSNEQIENLKTLIPSGKDVILGLKEKKYFNALTAKVHSIKDKESYLNDVKRDEIAIAEELGLYKWLTEKIKKSKVIKYKNFSDASDKIKKLQDILKTKNSTQIQNKINKIRETLV